MTNDKFTTGKWVFYFNPGHKYHMMLFTLGTIVPHRFDPQTGATLQDHGYLLTYGNREIFAKADQVMNLKDPKSKEEILNLRD